MLNFKRCNWFNHSYFSNETISNVFVLVQEIHSTVIYCKRTSPRFGNIQPFDYWLFIFCSFFFIEILRNNPMAFNNWTGSGSRMKFGWEKKKRPRVEWVTLGGGGSHRPVWFQSTLIGGRIELTNAPVEWENLIGSTRSVKWVRNESTPSQTDPPLWNGTWPRGCASIRADGAILIRRSHNHAAYFIADIYIDRHVKTMTPSSEKNKNKYSLLPLWTRVSKTPLKTIRIFINWITRSCFINGPVDPFEAFAGWHSCKLGNWIYFSI